MIIQVRDSYGDVIVVGAGLVYVYEDNPVYRETLIKNRATNNETPKITFSVTVKVKQMRDPNDPKLSRNSYQTVTCAIYGKGSTREIYALAKTLEPWERVDFMGTVYERTAEDASGNARVFREIKLESLTLPNRVAAMITGKSVTNAQLLSDAHIAESEDPRSSNDDYLFD